jgi:hypothetical protein
MSVRLRRALFWLCLAAFTAALVFSYQRFVLDAPPGAFKWQRGGKHFELLHPEALGLLLLSPLLVLGMLRSLADLPWLQRALSLLVRIVFLGLLAFGLSSPVRSETTSQIASVVLVDVSDSVSQEALAEAHTELERVIAARRPGDVVRLVTFAERPRLVELEKDGAVTAPSAEALRHEKARGGAGATSENAGTRGVASGRSVAIGRRTTNVEPLSSPSLCASTVPACISTSERVMASPRPRPF